MLLYRNPSDAQIAEICAADKHRAARWLMWDEQRIVWPASEANHATMARRFNLLPGKYEKGIMTAD